MSKYPHVPSAFINAIREEGTKEEACNYLQEQWNEICYLKTCGRVGAAMNTAPQKATTEDVQIDKLSGEICTPPIRSTDENGDELITFTSAHTLSDIARWIAENQTDAEEIIRILTDVIALRALAGEE